MRKIPAFRQIVRKPTLEEVNDAVESVIGGNVSHHKSVCIYVSQYYAGAMLNEIGQYYGMKDSAVSQANRRFKDKLQKDKTLQKIVEEVEDRFKMLIVET